jgi:spore germination protein YaaH
VTPPTDATQYANDFVEINKYCDRVKLMTYDQQTVDQKLANAANAKGIVYAPLADPAWIQKVIELASQTISKKKLVLGIPTYGYEWSVTAYADGYTYDLLWSFNPGYATPIAKSLGITPMRTSTGEIGFSYVPTTTKATFNVGTDAAASALQAAKADNSNHTFRFMTWEDNIAIAQKVALAKQLGLRGVAFFKFDGGADPGLWSVISGS